MNLRSLSDANKFIRLNNYSWAIAVLIILISIIVPVIWRGEIEVQPRFFHATLLPVMIFASLISGIVYFQSNKAAIIKTIVINLPILALTKIFFLCSYLMAFAYYSAAIIINSSIFILIKQLMHHQITAKKLSMILGHISLGIFIAAVTYNNNFLETKVMALDINQPKQFNQNTEVELSSIKYGNGVNYLNQQATIKLTDKNKILKLTPELRYYPIERSFSSKVSIIYSRMTSDWYCVINNIMGDAISVQITYQPAIRVIWLSVIMCICAILIKPTRINNNA